MWFIPDPGLRCSKRVCDPYFIPSLTILQLFPLLPTVLPRMLLQSLLLSALFPLFVLAQDDGSLSGPTSSSDAAGYSCDTTKCQLPSCNCASANPPGGLSPVGRVLVDSSLRATLSALPCLAHFFHSSLSAC
jgi:hypothetical protein